MYPTRRFRLLEYHGHMLSDAPRVAAFREALEATVTPGARVLDIGTGTGILAMLAARAGAGRVDAVEVSEVIEIARQLVETNELRTQVRLHQQLSYHLMLPERADVLVTETLGNFGLEEGILGVALDARFRLLKPGARIIPGKVRLFAAPLELEPEHRKVAVWGREVEGIDLSPLGTEAASLLWYVRYPASAHLAAPAPLGEVDLHTVTEPRFAGAVEVELSRAGTLHGFGGTFEAEIAPGRVLGNDPSGDATHWRQVFFPLPEPWTLEAGARVRFEVEMEDNGGRWRWSMRAGERHHAASTDDATLV